MSIDEIATSMLNGEPVHDGIIIGILFTVFIIFYETMFSSIFTIFKR